MTVITHKPFGRLALALGLGCLLGAPLAVTGCNSGGRDGSTNIPGINQSAAPLPDDGVSYGGPQMDTARYGHTATVLDDGKVLILGGTDERHLTSLDTGEVFDQSLFDEPTPPSISGAFLDTDVNGDPIAMTQGGRIFHTADLLPSRNVVVIGGTRDILIAEATLIAEIFDTQARIFAPPSLMIDDEMVEPRFRHSTIVLPSGRVLVTGGQIAIMETIIDTNFPPGHPLFQVDVDTFPSTETIETFNPTQLEFELVTDLSGNQTTLVTPRGRSDLGSVRIAGIDNVLGNSDDVVVHMGGYQTLSTIFAPQIKFPNQPGLDLQQGVEYFDSSTNINASAANINITGRANQCRVANLGVFKGDAVDGVPGVNNCFLVSHGDDNDICRTSIPQSEVVSVTFTGFGPGDGINFGLVQSPDHAMNNEQFCFDPCNFFTVGRSECSIVTLPVERTYNDTLQISNWIATAGGAFMFCPMGAQAEVLGINQMTGFMYFDPFYSPVAINVAGECIPLNDPPWNPEPFRGVLLGPGAIDLNPTGTVGAWLNQELNPDAIVPDNEFTGYAAPPGMTELVAPLSALVNERAFHTLSRVPGEDGIPNTFDDRILVVGGGLSVIQTGGEPVSISSEIFLPEGANEAN